MAEGLQRRIEYSDLKFISSFAMEKILDFQTWEVPREHARGNFRLLLSENETGINSMNAPIQLLGQGNTAGALFSGYPEKVEIKEERGYRIADIQAVSGTILLDQKKSNRVFQKKVQTYMGIASAVTADTDHSACILPGSDMRTGGTLIQYQETDWRFLKRMASQLGLSLVPDTSYYYPRFYLGLPEGEKRELGEIIACDLCFDGRYYAVSGKCLVDREDFICYDVVTRTSLSLGDRVTYEGRELLVSRKKTELAGGEVIFTYRLAGNSYTWVPWEDNPDYTGMSFVGSIVGTQGEQVEVAFDIDKTAAGGNRYGFAPATGNLMYCMPQKGTKTSLYIGNGDEAQGIATGCIRTNGSICEGTGSPEKKSFRSEHGKGMDLYPQRMGLDGGETGKITFEDETGTTIESNGGLVLMAKEGIRLESMTGIAMQGMSDIMALYSEGASSLCVNGSVDMLGRLAGISASKYTGYPPYDDAPKEGEFDWDGFTRNLAIGLGVVAVCAIGAAISIATLGAGSILAGAFIGAGIGALSTTAMKAGEEISTGNVRSAKEAFRDVRISAASGFITGAFGAKFPGAHRLVELDVDTEDALAGYADHSFDAITLWHVMEHLEHLNETWEKLFKLLKERGVLIVAVPNPSSYDAEKYKEWWAAYDVPRHLWHFTPSVMQQFGVKHGFKLAEQHPMPFDAFYVSMLTERYKGSRLSFLKGMWTGLLAWFSSLAKKERSSSMIYVFRKK